MEGFSFPIPVSYRALQGLRCPGHFGPASIESTPAIGAD